MTIEKNKAASRNRLHYAGLIFFTIIIGLFSREKYVPAFLFLWLGDALYALLIFFILGFVFNKNSVRWVAFTALVVCYAIEGSQLYQADWINILRRTKLGSLTLGHGFLWSDLLAYVVGVAVGIAIELGDGRGFKSIRLDPK